MTGKPVIDELHTDPVKNEQSKERIGTSCRLHKVQKIEVKVYAARFWFDSIPAVVHTLVVKALDPVLT